MHRDLNPRLFGPNQNGPQGPGLGAHPAQQDSFPPPGTVSAGPSPARGDARAPYPPSELKALEHQVATLKFALAQAEKRSEAFAVKAEELGRMVHGRLERFSQAIVRAEEMQAKSHQDTTAKLAQINSKVNERRVTDTKIQEMVDRHNSIIRNFENRLHSLTRVISEQEMALHNTQAALEEARAELAKHRR